MLGLEGGPDDLNRMARESASSIDTSRRGQLPAATAGAVTLGSLAAYAGEQGDAFSTSASAAELPLYAAFLALTAFAASELVNLCGRKDGKTLIAALINGAAVGSGIGLGIAGIAFGFTADILLTGGLGTLGLLAGALFAPRGRKVHDPCGRKLPCTTWICPYCRRIICPSKEWRYKDRWNILDVCEYLDTGGQRWDVVSALLFMRFSGLLDNPKRSSDLLHLWRPQDVRALALSEKMVNAFESTLKEFGPIQLSRKVKAFDLGAVERLMEKWEEFLGLDLIRNRHIASGDGGSSATVIRIDRKASTVYVLLDGPEVGVKRMRLGRDGAEFVDL